MRSTGVNFIYLDQLSELSATQCNIFPIFTPWLHGSPRVMFLPELMVRYSLDHNHRLWPANHGPRKDASMIREYLREYPDKIWILTYVQWLTRRACRSAKVRWLWWVVYSRWWLTSPGTVVHIQFDPSSGQHKEQTAEQALFRPLTFLQIFTTKWPKVRRVLWAYLCFPNIWVTSASRKASPGFAWEERDRRKSFW